MENEASLIEQIESYIDQLDLLGMQETIDQTRVDSVVERVKELATEYETLLDKKVETQIRAAEEIYAKNLEEERNKRNEILSAVVVKLNTFSRLFSKVFQIKVAANLQDHINVIKEKLNSQVKDYEDDLNLVEEQLAATTKAEEIEASLNDEKKRTHIELTNLRNTQITYKQLSDEIMALYLSILNEGNINQIDFTAVKEKEEAFKKRQGRYLENLELARSAKDAEEYVTMYEERVKDGKLELDKLAEQKFLHLLRKMLQAPIDGYEILAERTKKIQALANARCFQVEELYREGIVQRDEYGTLASKIDHSTIFTQLQNLQEIASNEKKIASIEEQLRHTRENIKGKDELEAIFVERAKERGRTAIIPTTPKPPEKPEILFGDEEAELNNGKTEPKRHLVISVEPPKPSLLDKLKKVRKTMTTKSSSNKVDQLIVTPEKYNPSIGDKIKLGNETMIYTNPMDVVELKDGKDAKSVNLTELELYVTRGAILDYTQTPIYITSDFGINLEEVAKEMNLKPGTYNIALGCSIGDNDGKFIGVTDDELNPDIEKGWINAADLNLEIINRMSEELKKGGMNK